MARGRKSAVSSYERRRWLEELEKGKGITEISKEAGRDIRVVKRHIEIALEERQLTQARQDFLSGRLEQHQDDLLTEMRRLRRVVAQWPPIRLEPSGSSKLKIFQAVKEHTNRLPLRTALDAYDQAYAEYEEARRHIGDELSKKEAELLSELPKDIVTYSWYPRLVDILEQGTSVADASSRSYRSNEEEGGACRPSWGDLNLTRSAIPAASVPAIAEAHKKLRDLAVTFQAILQDYRQRIEGMSEQVIENLDVFMLRRVVAGRCRFCPF